MGAIEQASQAPVKPSPKAVLHKIVTDNHSAIGASLPAGMDADRFTRLLLTAANTNPELLSCDPKSFLAAGVTSAQLGLEPNDPRGLAYLIPYNDKRRGKIVNFIIGYRGMMDLARRSGQVSAINAFCVYRQDTFSYQLGLAPTLHHEPGDHDENPADLTHVYAVAKVGGEPQFVVLTRRQVEKARSSSRGADSPYSPWTTNTAEMWCKTAIRRLCKFLPQTVQLARAVELADTPIRLGDLGHVIADDDALDVSSADVIDAEVME